MNRSLLSLLLLSLLCIFTSCKAASGSSSSINLATRVLLAAQSTGSSLSNQKRSLGEEEHHEDEEEEGEHHDDEEEEGGEHHDEFSATNNDDDDKPWGAAIGSALLINLATWTGLMFFVGGFVGRRCFWKKTKTERKQDQFTHNIIPMFAAGALLATAVFLIFPEALAMITAYQVRKALGGHDDHEDHEDEDAAEAHHDEEEGEHHDDEEEDGHVHLFLRRFLQTGEDSHEDEVDVDTKVAWRFGVCILAGFLIPVLSSYVFPHEDLTVDDIVDEDDENQEETAMLVLEDTQKGGEASTEEGKKTAENDDCEDPACDLCEKNSAKEGKKEKGGLEESAVVIETTPKDSKELDADEDLLARPPIDWALASSVLVGDFFHNFTDGVLIGTAWMLCSRELAITISAATVYHELAQEIADYFLLTKHCHLRVWMALSLNFVFGLSVLLGVIMILALDINENATGCILAIGGGVYLYIACGACVPRAHAFQTTVKHKAIGFLSFILGAIPIGLVLLNHGHCEEGHEH